MTKAEPDARPAESILVVDDDPRSRKLLVGYLRAEGYRVEEAENGETALASAGALPPDLVLLDVMMPGMTGYEVCKRLKEAPATRLCQVMLVTALDGSPDRVEGLDTGADDFVSKPVRREEFLAKVRALLRVRRLLVELQDARESLAARNEELQLKKTLAQSLVHDLKNPLSAILGNLDLLEIRAGDDLRYLVDRSRQGARRMLKMILNLLDVEGMEEGKLTPTAVRVDAADLARATVAECIPACEQKRVRLDLDAPDEVWLEADPVLLRRVMDNLISNAIAHSPGDGMVLVTARIREEGAEISVADEGPGIPDDQREQIFEKYAQLAPKRAGVSSNRGLGLTFCRLAVEAHGGTIWVEDAPNGGAVFRTLLPASAEAVAPEGATAELLR